MPGRASPIFDHGSFRKVGVDMNKNKIGWLAHNVLLYKRLNKNERVFEYSTRRFTQ